jgi:hypothetical protein
VYRVSEVDEFGEVVKSYGRHDWKNALRLVESLIGHVEGVLIREEKEVPHEGSKPAE